MTTHFLTAASVLSNIRQTTAAVKEKFCSCDDAEFYAHAKDVLINEMISKYENTIAKLKKQLDNIQINIVENAQ